MIHSYVYFAHFNNASNDAILVNSDKSVTCNTYAENYTKRFFMYFIIGIEAAKIIL